MLRRLIQWFKQWLKWLKNFIQGIFGQGKSSILVKDVALKQPAPPLSDTDLEFLFTELLEGVHQARGQAWAQKWLRNIEHRITRERWLEWLQRFGDKLLSLKTPNNELAARLVALGELEVGSVGQLSYSIGMQLLTRHQSEPIWEYSGPDTTKQVDLGEINPSQSSPDEGYQTVTLDELLVMLQQDENLRQQIVQQLNIQTDDPQVIVQALMDQLQSDESGEP
jgi:hypothetical protein